MTLAAIPIIFIQPMVAAVWGAASHSVPRQCGGSWGASNASLEQGWSGVFRRSGGTCGAGGVASSV